ADRQDRGRHGAQPDTVDERDDADREYARRRRDAHAGRAQAEGRHDPRHLPERGGRQNHRVGLDRLPAARPVERTMGDRERALGAQATARAVTAGGAQDAAAVPTDYTRDLPLRMTRSVAVSVRRSSESAAATSPLSPAR